jgi:hypothetical protein
MNKRLLAILALSAATCILIWMVGIILAPRFLADIVAYCESPLSHCPMHSPRTTLYIVGHVPWFLPVGCGLLLVVLASWGIISLRQYSRTSEN